VSGYVLDDLALSAGLVGTGGEHHRRELSRLLRGAIDGGPTLDVPALCLAEAAAARPALARHLADIIAVAPAGAIAEFLRVAAQGCYQGRKPVPVMRDGALLVEPADDPDGWSALVNSGEAVVTQTDDGTGVFDGRGASATSSSSAPGVMAEMLDLLDVREGMDVLEIGAGTGYNAALVAQRVAPGRVTAIEIDPAVAEHARRALRKTRCPVTVVTGDGALGHPEHAPYDRVMATAAVRRVPYAWVEQTRPGGGIVLPVEGSFRCQAFVRLAVQGDGTARGRFHGDAAFMLLPRPARRPRPVVDARGRPRCRHDLRIPA
jgi:protein-L-isoaspartate(D-aspartate) O-methyltransferase